MSKIIIIGARSGSQRVVNKNLRKIGDYPLLSYTIEVALKLNYPIYLSSDSEDILSYTFNKYSSVKIIKRPVELASNTSTDIEWIKHLLTEYGKDNKDLPEQLIFLRPTTPFRNFEVVKEAIAKFDKTKFTSLRSVEELKESGFKTFIISNGYLKALSDEHKDLPNALVPPTYSGNGYVDILITKQILESNTLYGDTIMPFITNRSTEIDTEEDLLYANFLYAYKMRMYKK